MRSILKVGLCLLAISAVATSVTARQVRIEGKAPAEVKDVVFTGTVCVIYEDNKVGNKVLGYSLRAPGKVLQMCFIRTEEGGDKIKAVAGEPAEGTVTVEVTGPVYYKTYPEGGRDMFMICKSAKKV